MTIMNKDKLESWQVYNGQGAEIFSHCEWCGVVLACDEDDYCNEEHEELYLEQLKLRAGEFDF